MKTTLITILCVTASIFSFAQQVEGGLLYGQSYYVGDLNPETHLGYNMNSGYGAAVRYVFNDRTAVRISYLNTRIEGDDARSDDPVQQNRNLHFYSKLDEISLTYEINFVNYALGDRVYWISPYMFGGLAYFKFNPRADLGPTYWDLQPMGTEGQFLPNSGLSPYKLGQISIPFGIGLKVNPIKDIAPFKWISINIEYGLRRTFTDYLDDVSGTYVNPDDLSPLTARLANRSLDSEGLGDTNYKMTRGDENTRDWYGFLGVSINIQLGGYGRTCKHLYE